MKVILRLVGVVLALFGLGNLVSATSSEGPSEAMAVALGGAHLLDALLLFVGAAGFFIWAAEIGRRKRAAQQVTSPPRRPDLGSRGSTARSTHWLDQPPAADSAPDSRPAGHWLDQPRTNGNSATSGPAAPDEESRVVVYGYTQAFAVNPDVVIFWDGFEVGRVGRDQKAEFPIDEDGEVRFKSSIRSAALRVQAGSTTRVHLTWDRVTGKLVPVVVSSAPPGF